VFRVMALPAPTGREKSRMPMQRYLLHFPAAGETVISDRRCYSRAGVERVMGCCPDEQPGDFLEAIPMLEKAMVESGIIVLECWLEASPEAQERRLRDRIGDGRKTWTVHLTRPGTRAEVLDAPRG
jgi:polyphosphate kinase 2 (PPK2 family)